MNTTFKIQIDLLNISFWVVYGFRTSELFIGALNTIDLPKDVKKLAEEFENEEYHGCVYVDKHKQVRLLHLINKSRLVHEVTHITDYISDYYRFRTEKEFRAYLHDYIVKTIKQRLKDESSASIKTSSIQGLL